LQGKDGLCSHHRRAGWQQAAPDSFQLHNSIPP
jgi:hypothetical protein